MESPLLWGDKMKDVVFAQIFANNGGLKATLGLLTPFVGLVNYKPEFEIVVESHRCNSQFQVGTWVGFCDFDVNSVADSKIFVRFNDDTKIWMISDYNPSFPVSFLHIFCGGFNGWERATKWMELNKIFSVQKEVSIDKDEQAMLVWQLRSSGELIYGTVPNDFKCPHKHVGCVAFAGQDHWVNMVRFQTNAVVTLSPPCVSWSRGGKGQGLECDSGLAFSESIAKIRILRPILVLVECADKTSIHPHYKIIRASLQAAGYKQVWTQIVPFESISGMSRTRWLAAWARADISDVQSLGSFRISDVQKAGWSSSCYDFPVPSQIQHQMKLSKGLKSIYGNPLFLPQSKRCRDADSLEVSEILKIRCLKNNDIMPTLCASYSQQHLIDEAHLRNKGIYAVLNVVNDEFQFFSPLLFVALLGATVTEPVFIPTKLSVAFQQIGNAISVPHAVLTLAVSFVAVGLAQVTISQTVLKAWNDRMTTTNTIVFRNKEFCIMCPIQLVSKMLPMHNMCKNDVRFHFTIYINGKSFGIRMSRESIVLDIFKQLGFEKESLKNVICTSTHGVIPWDTLLVNIGGLDLSFSKFGVSFLAFQCGDVVSESDCDSLDRAILSEIDQIEKAVAGIDAPILPCKDELEVPDSAKRQCIRAVNDITKVRATLFCHQGIPLATDELSWIIDVFASRQLLHVVQIVSTDWDQLEQKVGSIINACVDKKLLKCMCLINNHWFAIEIRKFDSIEFFCVNAPKDVRLRLSQFFSGWNGVNGFKGSFAFSETTYSHGFCGWELVLHWFGITLPQFDSFSQEINKFIEEYGQIAGKPPSERRLLSIWKKVCSARFHFLSSLQSNHSIEGIKIGLANPDQEMKDVTLDSKAELPDPWMKPNLDPWNQAKKSCKWEDLKLPDDHHFKDSKGDRLSQVHRQQISAKTSGIAFATKACVGDIFALSPPKATALLLPNSDKLAFPQLHSISITGPFEIVVRDKALNSIYKRQVLLVQTESEVVFELPKAVYTAVTTQFRELVVEIDERLITKDLAASIVAKPLESIRNKLIEQIPPLASKSLGVFGFRIVKTQANKEQHSVFQAVCKIHADQRVMCLERSGAGDAFIRDYVAKGETIDDLTIIPRFWDSEKLAKDDALRTSSSVPGFAGLVHTRRGIAVRAWCKQVASVRKILLAQDDRICEQNQAVIPRCLRDSTGWPSSVGPQEIVKASIHGVGLPPIPTRCYKAQGVTTWTLAFDAPPKIDKFMVQLNEKTFEIILTVPCDKPVPAAKGKKFGSSKGSGKSNNSVQEPREVDPKEDQNAQRISALEAKFSSMERRQDSLEGKINEGFHSVNDQLRQVLAAIQPRGASAHTGMTPPAKAPKTA